MRHLLSDSVHNSWGTWHDVEYLVDVDEEDFTLLEVYACYKDKRRPVLDKLDRRTVWRLTEYAQGVYSADQETRRYAGDSRY